MSLVLRRGIEFLSSQQQADGSFLSFSSSSATPFSPSRQYRSVFPAGLILASLCRLPAETGPIRDRLAAFLLSQRSEHWSFNYWARGAAENKTQPYPDDLDDTSCALAALTLHQPALVDPTALAKIVTVLAALENREGGPYRTWLVPSGAPEAWRDTDVAVNSNVAYFLSLHDVALPNLTAFVEEAITGNRLTSPYYPSSLPLIYFISRWYRGSCAAAVRDQLLAARQSDGGWGSELNTALAVSALVNLGSAAPDITPAIALVRRSQKIDGSWPAAAFCLDPAIDRQPYYAGSAALTTAFCLEALALAATPVRRPQIHATASGISHDSQRLAQAVRRAVATRFEGLDSDLRRNAQTLLEKTIAADADQQITLLPHFFRQALGKAGTKISDNLIIQLGAINLFGWIAYDVYDDFLDGEGTPVRLPVANVCLRQLSILCHGVLPAATGFPAFSQHILDTMEAANSWEATHCRLEGSRLPTNLPDFGNLSRLADRSCGHMLGPIAILLALSHPVESSQVQQVIEFFRHYLIARQLNDDAHDWEEDLARGRLNAVSTLIFRTMDKDTLQTAAANQLLTAAQAHFWQKTLPYVCAQTQQHIQAARQAAHTALLDTLDVTVLESLLKPIERLVHATQQEHTQTQQFLAAYGAREYQKTG